MSNSGAVACIGVGFESVWGTAVARTNWLRFLRCDLKESPALIPKHSIPGSTVPMPTTQVVDRMTAGGTLEIAAAYDDTTAALLAYCFGKAPTEGGGGGPTYTHSYYLAEPNATLAGMTLELIKNRIGSTNYADVFEGCVVSSWTLTIPDNGLATLSMEIIAQTSAARTTAGSPTFHTGVESAVLGWHGGNLAFSSLAGKVKSITISGSRNLGRRMLGGSQYTAEPKTMGLYSVTVQVVREHDENTMYTAFKAGTQADATITFTGPSSQSDAWTFHNAICTEYADPTTTPGVVDQSFTLTCHTDGTDLGLALVRTNTQTVYTAN